MQVNTEAPANEAKAEVLKTNGVFFFNVGFLTAMSLYSIAGLSIKIWESLLAYHDILFFCHVFTTSNWIFKFIGYWRLNIDEKLTAVALCGPWKVQRLRNALISEEAACDRGTWIFPSGHPFKQQRLGFWVIFPWKQTTGFFGGEDGVSKKRRDQRKHRIAAQAEAKAELKVGDVV